jgi:hypothetical protein
MTRETDMPPDRPFAALIERFPDMAALARQMGIPHSTVAAWKRRDQIPESRWRSIEAAAKAMKVRGVSYRALAAASAVKAGGDASQAPMTAATA